MTTSTISYTVVESARDKSRNGECSAVILDSSDGKRYLVQRGFNKDDCLHLWKYGTVALLKPDDTPKTVRTPLTFDYDDLHYVDMDGVAMLEAAGWESVVGDESSFILGSKGDNSADSSIGQDDVIELKNGVKILEKQIKAIDFFQHYEECTVEPYEIQVAPEVGSDCKIVTVTSQHYREPLGRVDSDGVLEMFESYVSSAADLYQTEGGEEYAELYRIALESCNQRFKIKPNRWVGEDGTSKLEMDCGERPLPYRVVDHAGDPERNGESRLVVLDSQEGQRYLVQRGYNDNDHLHLWRYGKVAIVGPSDTLKTIDLDDLNYVGMDGAKMVIDAGWEHDFLDESSLIIGPNGDNATDERIREDEILELSDGNGSIKRKQIKAIELFDFVKHEGAAYEPYELQIAPLIGEDCSVVTVAGQHYPQPIGRVDSDGTLEMFESYVNYALMLCSDPGKVSQQHADLFRLTLEICNKYFTVKPNEWVGEDGRSKVEMAT